MCRSTFTDNGIIRFQLEIQRDRHVRKATIFTVWKNQNTQKRNRRLHFIILIIINKRDVCVSVDLLPVSIFGRRRRINMW